MNIFVRMWDAYDFIIKNGVRGAKSYPNINKVS
jgi:hypothetical protein